MLGKILLTSGNFGISIIAGLGVSFIFIKKDQESSQQQQQQQQQQQESTGKSVLHRLFFVGRRSYCGPFGGPKYPKYGGFSPVSKKNLKVTV